MVTINEVENTPVAEREPFNIVQRGNFNVLLIGDLHISDRFTGRHKDYFKNCVKVLEMLTKTIRDQSITHVIVLGDWVGVNKNDKTLRMRETLLYVTKVLQTWNELTNGNVYSLRGNHDIDGRLTDFDYWVSLGYIKNPDSLTVGSTLFHFINYGDELKQINVDPDKHNVALMHNNIQIEGLTTWFNGGPQGFELSTLDNLYGVDIVVSGHIHNPSARVVQTSIRDKDIVLYYPGCPTRPKVDNKWDTCFGVVFSGDDNDIYLATTEFKLSPHTELFVKTFDDIDEEDEDIEAPLVDIEELSKILSELQSYNIGGGGDYKSQIIRFAGLDKEAADLAIEYIEKVEGELK